MAFITAPDFRIRASNWTLERPAQINVSGWTGRRTVVADPWHGKWRAEVELAALSEEHARAMRSFFARAKGSINTFRLQASVGKQNNNGGVTVASTAAAGATSMTISGADTPMLDGQYVTVNGQLLLLTANQSGSTINFQPPLRAQATAGTFVVTSQPYALVHLREATAGWSVDIDRVYGISFSVEEAILETDGTAPEQTMTGPITVTNHANTTVTAQGGGVYRVEKTGGGNGSYDASAVSAVVLSGDFVIRVKPITSTNDVFGVSTNPTSSAGAVGFGLSFESGGSVQKYEGGFTTIGTFNYATENLFLRRVGSTVTILKGSSDSVGSATLLGTLTANSDTVGFDSMLAFSGASADVYVEAL